MHSLRSRTTLPINKISENNTTNITSKLKKETTLNGIKRKGLSDVSNVIVNTQVTQGLKKPTETIVEAVMTDAPSVKVIENARTILKAVASPVITEVEMDDKVDNKLIIDVDIDNNNFIMPALASNGEVPILLSTPPCVTQENSADLFQFHLEMELTRAPSCRYMSKQTDITPKMRTILINWLVEVHRKFRNKQETLFLAINILDRFLEKKAVSRSKLQLVGVGALLIACKYEEIYAPEVNELVEMTDNAYTRDEVLQVECIILNTLQFELAVPNQFYFAQRILATMKAQDELQHLTMFILEMNLIDYKMLKWLPSVIATSAVYLALKMLNMNTWDVSSISCYSEEFIQPCVMEVNNILITPDPKEESIRQKYSNPKYKSVSKIPTRTSFK